MSGNQSVDVALVGMACRFPGANSLNAFWHNLVNGVESIIAVRDWTPDPEQMAPAVPFAAPLTRNIDAFDRRFFGLSAKDSSLLDPQHRLFLECAWHALESGGVIPGDLNDTGLFAGCMQSSHLSASGLGVGGIDASPFEVQISNDKDYLTTRTAYHLGLGGPVYTVQSACSTGLVAVVQAIDSLRAGRCRIALAGASTVRIPQLAGYHVWHNSLFSEDGHCRPFSRGATGTIFGSGVAVVVLKRLDDALADDKNIIAVLKGGAVNNDGGAKVGFSTTSLKGQKRLLRAALKDAGISVDRYRAVETHGAGTEVGDPIEFQALQEVFEEQTAPRNYCALGAVKANIGHLENAAGIAGLVKAALQIRHGWITPQINFSQPLDVIDLETSPFTINTQAVEWRETDSRNVIGVSSFGIGGTNAHVVLARPPSKPASAFRRAPVGPSAFIPLSAASEPAWHTLASQYRNAITRDNSADIAYSAQTKRKALAVRGAISSETGKVLHSARRIRRGRTPIVFQFPGQGSQYIGMASQLLETSTLFREILNHHIDELKHRVRIDISAFFKPDGDPSLASRVEFVHPAMVAVEIATARYLSHIGLRPDYVMGHSLGEIAAAVCAGILDPDDAIAFAAQRAAIIASLPAGVMLAVESEPDRVRQWTTRSVALAAVNSAHFSVLSGPAEDVGRIETELHAADISCMRVASSHAFHSPMMDAAAEALSAIAPKPLRGPETTQFVSTVTRRIMQPKELDVGYWARQVCETIHYADALGLLADVSPAAFVEIGPGSTLTTYALQARASMPGATMALRTMPRGDEPLSQEDVLHSSLLQMWISGIDVKWSSTWAVPATGISLPAYPFEASLPGDKTRRGSIQSGDADTRVSGKSTDPVTQEIDRIWATVLGEEPASDHANFFEMGGHSLMAISLLGRLEKSFSVKLSMPDFLASPSPVGVRQIVEHARLGGS